MNGGLPTVEDHLNDALTDSLVLPRRALDVATAGPQPASLLLSPFASDSRLQVLDDADLTEDDSDFEADNVWRLIADAFLRG